MMMARIRTWINIFIVVLLVGEPLLFPFRFLFPMPLLFLKHTWIIQVGIGFCIILLNLKIQTRPIAWRIIALGITLPLCCLGLITFSGVEQVRDTAQLGENRFYLITRTKAPDPACNFFCNFTVPALYRCNSIGLHCTLVFENDFVDVLETGLAVDKDTNELQVFLSFGTQGSGFYEYGLFYVYGKQSRFVQETEKFGASIYYLTTPQGDHSTYMLYECQQDSIGCKRLPFEYVTTYYLAMNIDSMGELSIIDERYNNRTPADLLVYTYNINHLQPDCKTEACALKDK